MVTETQNCQLYVMLPASVGPGMVRDLTETLRAGEVSCLLARKSAGMPADRDLLARLVEVAHEGDCAFLVEDDIDLVLSIGADGVHLTATEESEVGLYQEARARLGDDKNIGIHCGLSRHSAMIFGEAGADYVAFGPYGLAMDARLPSSSEQDVIGLLSWLSALFQPPCVAWDVEHAGNAKAFCDAGADFIATEKLIWEHEDGAPKGVSALTECLAGRLA